MHDGDESPLLTVKKLSGNFNILAFCVLTDAYRLSGGARSVEYSV